MVSRKLFEIDGVLWQPIIDGAGVVYFISSRTNFLCKWHPDTDSIESFEGLKFYSIEKWDNYIVHNSLKFINKERFFLEREFSKSINVEGRPSFVLGINECTLLIKAVNDEKETVHYYSLDFLTAKTTLLDVSNPKAVIKDQLICQSSVEMMNYSLSSNSINWRVDFSQKSKWLDENGVMRVASINRIEIFEELILVSLNNDMLIGLELSTGKVKWERQMPIRILTPATFSKGKMFWFSLGQKPVYHVVDLRTGLVESTIKPSDKINDRLTFTELINYSEWLVMTSLSTYEIFILNKQTLSVDGIIEIPGCKNRIPISNTPFVQDGCIYQLDGDNRLHVFEFSFDQM